MHSLPTTEKLRIKVCVWQGNKGGTGPEERTLKRKKKKKHNTVQRVNNIDLNQIFASPAEAHV